MIADLLDAIMRVEHECTYAAFVGGIYHTHDRRHVAKADG